MPLIQMETISRSTGKIHKTSQGGLTPPALYDSGLDFPNRGRKTRKRRQVRISCIFVAHHFCARVKSRIVTVKYSNISMCLYKRSLMYPHRWKMTVTPLQWKMTPPMENESHPTSGNNSVDPTEGIMYGDSSLTPQWK